ncbi:MAG: ATP-binding protein [Rariglobus sp.]
MSESAVSNSHASSPDSEAERLGILRSYHILDTAPESEYDDLVALAAQICGVPMASLTLIDETRQWFKASVGFDVRETPRSISFCSHAIAQKEKDLFVVADARHDPRFRDFPNVVGDPRIGFYAGAPLVNEEGFALGTLCVIDKRPRELTPEQTRALRVLRHHVVNALELRRLVGRQKNAIEELEATRLQLDLARRQAEDAARAKSQFLAAMSHEIRTPMNAVVGMTTLLRSTPLNTEQQDCVDTIRTSGELLLTVINDILDFSKIESGKMTFEHIPFEVARCVADAIDLLAASAQAKHLALHTIIDANVPAFVNGDVTRIRQILVNLLSNAVKFTERGAITVRLGLGAPRTDGLELQFSVQDSGIGIPADRIDRLFQQFCQVDVSTTRRYGGTGLGLAISKRLAEIHGGRMWVSSQPGQGSTFSFTIHATVAAQTTPESARAATEPVFDTSFATHHPVSLLVAEDNPVNQKVVRRILEKLGYTPEIVANGIEVLAALRRHPFDAVLMDVEMPEMDGLTATRTLRTEIPRDRQPAVIAVTAHALESDREHFGECQMDHCLTKPLRLGELTAALALVTTWRDARRADPAVLHHVVK